MAGRNQIFRERKRILRSKTFRKKIKSDYLDNQTIIIQTPHNQKSNMTSMLLIFIFYF